MIFVNFGTWKINTQKKVIYYSLYTQDFFEREVFPPTRLECAVLFFYSDHSSQVLLACYQPPSCFFSCRKIVFFRRRNDKFASARRLAFFREIQKLVSGKKVVSPPGELFVFKLISSEFRLLSSVFEMRIFYLKLITQQSKMVDIILKVMEKSLVCI